jgi:hypothetical protein
MSYEPVPFHMMDCTGISHTVKKKKIFSTTKKQRTDLTSEIGKRDFGDVMFFKLAAAYDFLLQ